METTTDHNQEDAETRQQRLADDCLAQSASDAWDAATGRSAQDTTLKRVCSWCSKEMGIKPGDGQDGITDGMCDQCRAEQLDLLEVVDEMAKTHVLIRDLMGVVRGLLPLLNTAEALGEWEHDDSHQEFREGAREKLVAGVETARAVMERAIEAGYGKEPDGTG